jgi:hypothetical protein
MLHIDFVTAPYLDPLLAFAQNYGLMVAGAVLTLIALSGRKFGPLALVPLVIGLGIVVAGAARFLPGFGH